MQELLLNQWLNYTILVLNAVVAGQILWFSIKLKKSKILQYALFTLGMAYAIAIGGIFKAPGFIVNPEVQVFWLFLNAFLGIYVIYSFVKESAIHIIATYIAIVLALIGAITVFTGILEFGMRYMPTILFYTICVYSGMGLDPIWLGILIAINLQTSFLTPPFGFAIFYLKSVIPKEVETVDIYKGVIPFILIQIITIILIILVPEITTWLPNKIFN